MLLRLMLLALAALAYHPAAATDFYVEIQAGVSEYDGVADSGGGLPPGPVTELSIDGFPFESTESTWSVLGGWQLRDWFAVEAGYTDLGQSRWEPQFAIVAPGPGSFIPPSATLDVDQWFLGARFSTALSDAFLADWTLGLARSAFDVDGGLPGFVGQLGAEPQDIPFASPGDETGAVWGIGFRWRLNPRFDVGLNYRQHNTGVIDVQAVTLGLRLAL